MTDSMAVRRKPLIETAGHLSDSLAVPQPQQSEDDNPRSTRWWHQSLAKGAAGVAILHGIRAQDGIGAHDRVHAWLTCATGDDLSAARSAGLWFGAPAVAFALAVAAPGQCPTAAAALDNSVKKLIGARLHTAHVRLNALQRPALSEFDVVRGLTGLGAYLLRVEPDNELLLKVLTYLVRLTEPLVADDHLGTHVPGWWTLEQPTQQSQPALAQGHANSGMAHGIAGPLALLSLTQRKGVTVTHQTDAIERICSWLDRWCQESPSGPWWPEWITRADLREKRPRQRAPGRASWCYGTPGLARAQQLAGIAIADSARQDAAEIALTRCLSDVAQLTSTTGSNLCHGLAGSLATAWCAAADARSPLIGMQMPFLTNALFNNMKS
ncbi:MAG: lanthionine synthetase C family protein, partial [Terriglobales bacterium]